MFVINKNIEQTDGVLCPTITQPTVSKSPIHFQLFGPHINYVDCDCLGVDFLSFYLSLSGCECFLMNSCDLFHQQHSLFGMFICIILNFIKQKCCVFFAQEESLFADSDTAHFYTFFDASKYRARRNGMKSSSIKFIFTFIQIGH